MSQGSELYFITSRLNVPAGDLTHRLHHKRRLIVPFHQVVKRIFSDIEKGTPFPTRRHTTYVAAIPEAS